MKNITRPIAIAAVVLTASLSLAQTRPTGTPPPATPQDRIAPTERSPRAAGGLGDLDAMTFGCPKAALNAAARAAAAVKSEGTYQFSYFRILNSSHHAAVEVHFTSNFTGEPDLKYCVTMYCQQGWDPATLKTEVALMSDARPAKGMTDHAAACRAAPAAAPVRRGVKR